MLISFTKYFDIDKSLFEKTGAFDTVLGKDTRLFIDPFLLADTGSLELANGREKILSHFNKILVLLIETQSEQDATWKQALKLFSFPEVKGFNFGYSKKKSHGSGMGENLQKQLLKTALEVVRKGITNPVIFELVGIFEEGIGCDRISDMVCRILYLDFLIYTQRIAKELKIPTEIIIYKGISYQIPINPFKKDEPIILVPMDILRDLPLAHDWDDISFVCAVNADLRERVSSIIGLDWQDKTKRLSKKDFRFLLLDNPTLLQEIISQYEKMIPIKYDYINDPSGEANWYPIATNYTSEFPIVLQEPVDLNTLKECVITIVGKFKQLIEYNGLNKFCYKENGQPKHESAAQLLFNAIAIIYCEANNLSIAREPNSGRGPVDFKLSKGSANVVLEIKLSTNNKLVHAYKTQVPIYKESENSSHSIIVVLKVKEESKLLDKLLKQKQNDSLANQNTPEIIVVNAVPASSASKM